jgi:hypothetical protein
MKQPVALFVVIPNLIRDLEVFLSPRISWMSHTRVKMPAFAGMTGKRGAGRPERVFYSWNLEY